LKTVSNSQRQLFARAQVAVTYWRAGGGECENDSALPINLAKDSHAHTDGGLILWRADNDND